jgi:hypothetical protein
MARVQSSGLLHLEVSQARVFQSSLKTGGGAVRMVPVALLRGCVEMKPKMDASMRFVALDSSTLTLPFSL